MPINLYGISFRNFVYFERSINSILAWASEPLEITIVDNPCKLPNSGTNAIRYRLREMVEEGKIKRALLFEENVIGWALVQAIKDFPPSGEFFFMTDLDLIVPAGCDWIGKTKKAHAEGCLMTGANLSTENYTHPNSGFDPNSPDFGLWLVGMNTAAYNSLIGPTRNTIDHDMIETIRTRGEARKLKSIELYHQAWDNHKVDLEYQNYKASLGIEWARRERPLNMNYELIEL